MNQPNRFLQLIFTYLDMDAYLSEDTLAWCQQTIGPHTPRASEFLPTEDRTYLIPEWYRRLLCKARDQASCLPTSVHCHFHQVS